jgi:hypothetical protein
MTDCRGEEEDGIQLNVLLIIIFSREKNEFNLLNEELDKDDFLMCKQRFVGISLSVSTTAFFYGCFLIVSGL